MREPALSWPDRCWFTMLWRKGGLSAFCLQGKTCHPARPISSAGLRRFATTSESKRLRHGWSKKRRKRSTAGNGLSKHHCPNRFTAHPCRSASVSRILAPPRSGDAIRLSRSPLQCRCCLVRAEQLRRSDPLPALASRRRNLRPVKVTSLASENGGYSAGLNASIFGPTATRSTAPHMVHHRPFQFSASGVGAAFSRKRRRI